MTQVCTFSGALNKEANPHPPPHTLYFPNKAKQSTDGRTDGLCTRASRRLRPPDTSPAIMRPPGRRRVLAAGACALLLAATFLAAGLLTTSSLAPYLLPPLALSLPCLPAVTAPAGSGYGAAPGVAALAEAAVAYATSETVPQQSVDEISLSLAVLRRRAPLRLLVFGLGHDSRLWHALNPGGATVFLEEDPAWYRVVRAQSPFLRAHLVAYRTRLDQADRLLATYRRHPACLPGGGGGNDTLQLPRVRGNWACPLALYNLPPEVYETEWDMVMIDAPKGYFAAAPGRMAAIWTAAAMARARQGEGDTDVFLHDVDRRVEKAFAEEFLCERFRVGGTGRLWHFRIPPVSRRGEDGTATAGDRNPFC